MWCARLETSFIGKWSSTQQPWRRETCVWVCDGPPAALPPPLVELDSTQKRNNVNFFLSQLAHLRVVDSIDWIISLRCYKLNHPPFFFNFLQLMMADVVSNESRRVWLDLFIYLWLLRADFREKTKKKTFDSCSVQKKGTRGLANDEKEANVMKDSIYIRASVGGWLLLFNPRLFPLSPPHSIPPRNAIISRGGGRALDDGQSARARVANMIGRLIFSNCSASKQDPVPSLPPYILYRVGHRAIRAYFVGR